MARVGAAPSSQASAAGPATPATPAAAPPTPVRRPRPAPSSDPGTRAGAVLNSTAARITSNGGGFLLALLVWGWVGLPFLRGGPAQVRNVLRAKFVNKGPDGKWLP